MPWFIVFLLSCLPVYWAYLLFNTQPVMIYDAIGYDEMGRLILNQGLHAYFESLNREPLFPYLISRAMLLSREFGWQYHFFLKGILLVFLAATLAGIYRLTRLLGAGRMLSGLAVFYAGVSPAILNSTLWLWSEAAALPWGVWGVFFCIKTWRAVVGGRSLRRIASFALIAAVLFTGLLLVKAAVSAVVIIYGLPFLAAGIVLLVSREFRRAGAFMLAGLIFLGAFTAVVEGYKAFNFRMNGNYALTTRFHWALYGNTVRRLEPLTKERIAEAVLSVPRLGFCEKIYGQACVFWSFQMSDTISEQANNYCTAKGFSPEEQRKFMVDGSFKMMAHKPFQQVLMSALEGAKMLFWENRVYFVRYPPWLAKLYADNSLVYSLCFGWALFSLAALGNGLIRCSSEYRLTASFVFWFIAVHSIFFIDIRYALPIAPLFIVLTAGLFVRSDPVKAPPLPTISGAH